MSDKTLLDIDDTIVPKNLLLFKNEYESKMDDMLKQQIEGKNKSIIIHPSPGVCVKTKTDKGEKVFLNICTTTKIPDPKDISEERLMSLLDEEDSDYSIPMSIGEERLEPDKGGKLCATHDIAISKAYFEKCRTNGCFWLFTILVIMEGVSNKFGKSLDTKSHITLKNRKVMGTIQPQCIDYREESEEAPEEALTPSENPLIQEISSSSTPVQSESNDMEESKTEDYVLLREPSEGTAKRLIGLFRIPDGMTSKDLNVLVDIDHIIVTTYNNDFAHDLYLPFIINIDETEAIFHKNHGVLRLNMPIIKEIMET